MIIIVIKDKPDRIFNIDTEITFFNGTMIVTYNDGMTEVFHTKDIIKIFTK